MKEPRIEIMPATLLVGRSLEMSRENDKTPELWRSFMPIRGSVHNRKGSHFYSVQLYPKSDPEPFKSTTVFTKWAAVEVTDFESIPGSLEPYTMKGGQYAVFEHIGPARTFPMTIATIFTKWLPTSGYSIDDRAHFEKLEEGYSPIDENAREEIWIPIK